MDKISKTDTCECGRPDVGPARCPVHHPRSGATGRKKAGDARVDRTEPRGRRRGKHPK